MAGTNDSNDEDYGDVDFIQRPVKQTVEQITPQVCFWLFISSSNWAFVYMEAPSKPWDSPSNNTRCDEWLKSQVLTLIVKWICHIRSKTGS